jgi:hypothetical protein
MVRKACWPDGGAVVGERHPPPERLADRQYVTLILRLLVDGQGDLVQGEVGALEADQGPETWVRFRGADDLLTAVRSCLRANRACARTSEGTLTNETP